VKEKQKSPVYSVTWSSEIILISWFGAQEKILRIIIAEKKVFSSFFDEQKVQKNNLYLKWM